MLGTQTRHAIVTGAAHIDNTAAETSWQKDVNDAVDLGHHRGEDPTSDVVKARIIENHNGTSLAAIQGFIDRKDPQGAQAFLDMAKKKGMITGEAIDKATKEIIDTQDRVGVAETVNKTFDPKKSVEKNIDDASKEWDKTHGGDPVGKDRVVSQVMTKHAVVTAEQKQDLDTANSTIDEFISKIKPGGPPITADDLRDNPELKDAFSKIESDTERAGQADLAINKRLQDHYNGDITLTPERQSVANQLIGLSHTDSSAFINTDLWKQDLTSDQRKELRRLQEGMQTSGTNPAFRDRATEQVMGDMRQQIKDGIGERGTPEYNEFRGALQVEFDEARAKGKVIDPKMAQDMATKLLQSKVLNPNAHWYNLTKSGHAYQPDEDQAAEIRQQRGPNLSDDEVQKIYLKKLNDVLINKVPTNAGQ